MANRPRAGRLPPADRAAEARRLRNEHDLTQREIAERLDVSPSTVAKDLRGFGRTRATNASADSPPRRAGAGAPTPSESSGPRSRVRSLIGVVRSLIGTVRRLLP